MVSITDGVKIGVGMFIVLPLIIAVIILVSTLLFSMDNKDLILVVILVIISIFIAKKYKGEGIIAKVKNKIKN